MQKLVILIESVEETFVNLIFQETQKNVRYCRIIEKRSIIIFHFIKVIKEWS